MQYDAYIYNAMISNAFKTCVECVSFLMCYTQHKKK